jgi:hypothetical protein
LEQNQINGEGYYGPDLLDESSADVRLDDRIHISGAER